MRINGAMRSIFRVTFWSGRGILAVALALSWHASARAYTRIDGIEHIFGATNVNAITGHGRMSVGVSKDGDVTVLTWPSPSGTDQLGYLSSNAIEARSMPRLGAPESAGMFFGLLLEHEGECEVTWLRDPVRWRIEQSYGAEDGPNVVTTYADNDPESDLSVEVTDAVSPSDSSDVLVRSVRITRGPGSTVSAAWLLTYANLSPQPPNSRIAELPIADWVFDGSNDFAAIWDADHHAILHFHPNDQGVYDEVQDVLVPPARDFGPIGAALKAGTQDEKTIRGLVSSLDDDYAAGTYLALATLPAADQFQLGYDTNAFCDMRDEIADNLLDLPSIFPGLELPIDVSLLDLLRCRDEPPVPVTEGWKHDARDAFENAGDGELSGSPIAAGEVNEALRTPLVFQDDVARAALILAAGDTATGALAGLTSVVDPDEVLSAARQALNEWIAQRRLPESQPAEVRAVARRSLINLRVGTDRQTGMIVASISRQPPYGLDWPRDGAFFNVALDLSGQSDVVDRRVDLYLQWQRREAVAPTAFVDQPPPVDPRTGLAESYPAGAWEMNHYPDGRPGGPFRFEIDNTGFALWSIVSHVGWVPAAERIRYLEDRWDGIRRAANLLAGWRDAMNLLQAPASEDDNGAYTQTLHGAVTTYGALDYASRAATMIGRGEEARHWRVRACELRAAIEDLLYDENARRFVSQPGQTFDPQHVPTGQTAWLIWPFRVLPWDDARIGDQVRGDLEPIGTSIRLENAGGSYFMKSTVSMGLAAGDDPEIRPALLDFAHRLAADHATPATHHFGEAMVVRPGKDGPVALQTVANPHLWEGVLFYLTAMSLDAPEAFGLDEEALPAALACDAAQTCVGDCNGDGSVDVSELVRGVDWSLDSGAESCLAFDRDFDGRPSIAELVQGLVNALGRCN